MILTPEQIEKAAEERWPLGRTAFIDGANYAISQLPPAVPVSEEEIAPPLPQAGAALKCRHGCDAPVRAVVYASEGCLCFTDPVQALCAQHYEKMASAGPIEMVVDFWAAAPPLPQADAELASFLHTEAKAR